MNRIRFFKVFTILSIFFLSSSADAQDNGNAFRQEYWGDPDAYYIDQTGAILKTVEEGMDAYPPVAGATLERKLILYHLDAILHETKHDFTEPFMQFFKSRISKVIRNMDNPVQNGMRVYKLYNESFVARTKSVTIAFDLVRRKMDDGNQLFSDEDIKSIVDRCDILFLSHDHDDHVDPVVVDMFLKEGKTVVATSGILADKASITHRRAGKITTETLILGNGQSLGITILPGHQGTDMANNIYVVTTPEGFVIAHTGDQSNDKDMEWIVNVNNVIPAPDVLIVNCWTNNMEELINGFNPKVVTSGHENELGHSIDHREAFWLTLQKFSTIRKDSIVMGWGEWFDI